MHHFRTKEAVVKALLEHQMEHFTKFAGDHQAGLGDTTPEPLLATQIATLRETISQPQSAFLAILGAVAEDPGLLAGSRDLDAANFEAIRAEAADPDLAILRWMAAKGLALTTLLGVCPMPDAERDRLFACLLDGKRWSTARAGAEAAAPAPPARSRKRGAG